MPLQITRKQLEFWRKHRRNQTLPDRLDAAKDPLTYEEWIAIEELAARLRLGKSGTVSQEFADSTAQLLLDKLDPDARQILQIVSAEP